MYHTLVGSDIYDSYQFYDYDNTSWGLGSGIYEFHKYHYLDLHSPTWAGISVIIDRPDMKLSD